MRLLTRKQSCFNLTAALRRAAAQNSGQSLLEFALILPLLTWILLGTIDFARAYYAQVAITNAARVGAEFGMDSRRSFDEIEEVIKRECSAVQIADSDITLAADPSWSSGSELTVTVRTKFYAVTPLISSLWGGGPLQLEAQVKSRFN